MQGVAVKFLALFYCGYALSLMMLPLLETFFELLWLFFWMSLVSWNLCYFKADLIFGNSQKSFIDISGE